MPTNTYVALDKVTVSTATPSVTFTGISGAYTDLVVVCNVSTSTNSNLYLRYNNDATSNYSNTVLNGSGTTATSARNTAGTKGFIDSEAYAQNNFNYNATIHVMNYANTTTKKTTLTRANNSAIGVTANVLLYGGTSAISQIDIFANAGNLQTGSTFSLYGIAAEGAAYATGGYVTSDANYYYHTFTASGTFTPQQSLTADVLVVAGGGGAMGGGSAGAGAGGLLAFASQALTATPYTVTVGAGGVGGVGDNATPLATSGGNSQFGALTAAVGGGYAPRRNNGISGGSGSGATASATVYSAGTGTAGQGNNGGTSLASYTGGGGGGAGAVGGNASSGQSGAGGIGSSTYSSWGLTTGTGHNVAGTIYYAGGGGAAGQNATGYSYYGEGGFGGGGAGAVLNGAVGSNGLSNTGGGGGGGWAGTTDTYGGNGGSGIVIIRYAN